MGGPAWILLSYLRDEGVVPFGQEVFVLDDVCQELFDLLGGGAAGFVDLPHHVDGGAQAGLRRGVSHELNGSFQRVEQVPAAGAADVRKQSTFDGVVLGTVAGVVSHSDRQVDGISELLKVIFHDEFVRCVATAAIEQQQNRFGMGITLTSDAVPVPPQALAGKLAGVV